VSSRAAFRFDIAEGAKARKMLIIETPKAFKLQNTLAKAAINEQYNVIG